MANALPFLWLVTEHEAYRMAYARHWSSTANEHGQEVDVVLYAQAFEGASPHGQSRYRGYGALLNLLGILGAAFPVTTVDLAENIKDLSYKPCNAEDQFAHQLYGEEQWAGLPVSLQIVGCRHMDGKVLAALKEIELVLGRTSDK